MDQQLAEKVYTTPSLAESCTLDLTVRDNGKYDLLSLKPVVTKTSNYLDFEIKHTFNSEVEVIAASLYTPDKKRVGSKILRETVPAGKQFTVIYSLKR